MKHLLRASAVFLISVGKGWRMTEPVSLIQTNLHEIDSILDPRELVACIKAFRANRILFSLGDVTLRYPTEFEHDHASARLPTGRDQVGDVVRIGHQEGMWITAGFDLNRARKEVYAARSDWLFTRHNGDPLRDSAYAGSAASSTARGLSVVPGPLAPRVRALAPRRSPRRGDASAASRGRRHKSPPPRPGRNGGRCDEFRTDEIAAMHRKQSLG